MLPEIAAEALSFLTRRDLDKACAVSKWLEAMIAQCCGMYPLRPVTTVRQYPGGSNFTLKFCGGNDGDSETPHSSRSMSDAVHFAWTVIRHSYVERFQFGDYDSGSITLLPDHWKALVDAIQNFSVLREDTFLAAVGCRGLESLTVYQECTVPSGFVTDALIRASVAQGLLKLYICWIESDAPHRLSDEAILDFFFRADGRQSLRLALENHGVTEMFVAKFFQRLLSGPVRPSGSLWFGGAGAQHAEQAKQRGLSVYSRYLEPDGYPQSPLAPSVTYLFPPIDDESKSYAAQVCEDSV